MSGVSKRKFLYFKLYINNLSKYWSLYAGTEIPANADMHDYMTPGNYYHPKSSTAKTLVNCPLTDAFQLKVTAPIENSTGGYLLQEYTAFDGKSVIKVHYDSYLQKWVEPVVYVTNDDLPNIFTTKLGTPNQEGNHVTTIKGLWNSFPEKQVFACNLVDSNNFCVFGFIYGDHNYGAVLYLAYNSCGIVKCSGGNFSDTKL